MATETGKVTSVRMKRTSGTEVSLSGKTIALSGMETGIIAGIFMILALMIHSFVVGAGFWTPMNLIAATWFGHEALAGGSIIGIVGFVTHVAVSAIWGAVFSAFVGRGARSFSVSLLVGLLVGIIAWMVMTYFVLPWADPVMRVQVAQMSAMWFLSHLVFGASLVLTPFFARVPSYDQAWHRERVAVH